MFHDMTARLATEEALRDSEERYRQLFEGIDDAIFVHDLEANILDVNEAAVAPSRLHAAKNCSA